MTRSEHTVESVKAPAPQELLDHLAAIGGMNAGRRRLVVLMGQLGDFDSLEYAQALTGALPSLQQAGIAVQLLAIGHPIGADRFCTYTGFPRGQLEVMAEPELHRRLGLYAGLQVPGGVWPALLLMCAGFGSPGTLAEVLRGYTGDRTAAERISAEQTVHLGALPTFSGALFASLGRGYQRPFELATVRLQNMIEVLSHWRIYVPRDDHLTQRGATYLLDADDTLLYSHTERGILGFSATMARPLQYLEPYLHNRLTQTGPADPSA